MEEGKLLCEKCGEEVKIVPDFDIELEARLKESISSMIEEIAGQEQAVPSDRTGPEHADKIHARESARILRMKIVIVMMAAVVAVACIIILVRFNINADRYNSFAYQYEKAVECAASGDLPGAVSHLERAAALDPDDLDVRFLLATYYDENGQQQSTMTLLEEILKRGADYPKRDEVYDMLLGIYEIRADYIKMSEALKLCDIPSITAKYSAYAAPRPKFDKEGGTYAEPLTITITGSRQGKVHYTLDGTEPTYRSPVYGTPLELGAGDHIIRAVYINPYGVASEIESRHYHIDLPAPDSPVVDPESGAYAEPHLIEVFHDDATKVFYTTDGTVPAEDSDRYMDPLEMPYGTSSFSFVSVDASGQRSEVVNRTYQLEIQANFDPELAIQVLKNNLWLDGRLLDADGRVPNKPGMNQYRVQTLYRTAEALYYIIYEEYADTDGTVLDTTIYAVDVNTADLYRAYKVDEGRYSLQPYKAP